MKPGNLTSIIALTVLFFLIIGCDKTYISDDPDPPPEVFGLEFINGDSKVFITWNDPTNTNFDYVEITYLSEVIEVESGVETCEISGLTNDSTYYITLRTVSFSGDKSVGMKVDGRPKIPPEIQWTGPVVSILDYSPQGHPSGTFKVTRSCKNNGLMGYAMMNVIIINTATNDTMSNTSKNLFFESNVDYKFYFEANSDITIFNCTTCQEDSTSYRIEFNLLNTAELFYYEPVCCLDIPVCANGNNNMSIRWNSITARNIFILKE